IVAKEIRAGGHEFEIKTSKPNVKVSWQVTGIRKDAYANAHRIKVVERKTGAAAGMYLHPELFGRPGMRPLGLDVPSPAKLKAPATARAQARLFALVQQKAKEAREEAAAARAHQTAQKVSAPSVQKRSK